MSSRRSARRAQQPAEHPSPPSYPSRAEDVATEELLRTHRISPKTLGLVLMALIGVIMLITTGVLWLVTGHLSPLILTLGVLLIVVPAGYGLWRAIATRQNSR
ncbi:hypothetical protein DCC26_03740 [Auritidibacter sp. NML120779]|nr:hypothetical protein DCC26_03740 [Auritidibacter sp. NML120779]